MNDLREDLNMCARNLSFITEKLNEIIDVVNLIAYKSGMKHVDTKELVQIQRLVYEEFPEVEE